MLLVEDLRNMSSLGRLRYLLEQEFEKSKVDKMIEAAAHYRCRRKTPGFIHGDIRRQGPSCGIMPFVCLHIILM